MSNLWAVPSEYLDSKRLLRHHQTIHKLITACTKNFAGQSKNRFYSFGGYLVWRHYEAVREMYIRGMRHESYVDQLWKMIPNTRRLIRFHYTKKQIYADIKRLKLKQHRAETTASSYGRTPLHFLHVGDAGLNEMVDAIAQKGFPKDIFLI